MRTTIRLDDDLVRQAKRLAVDSGRTLTQVVDEALRQMIARHGVRRSSGPVVLPTFGGGRVMPGVDLDDNASVRDLIDEDADQKDPDVSNAR